MNAACETRPVCAVSQPHRAVMVLSGPDRVSFLQGLVTADVTRVGPDQAAWSALLTPQGKYLFDFFLVAQGDHLVIEAERDRLPDLAERLLRHRLRAAIALEPRPDWRVVVLFGAGAGSSFDLPDRAGAACSLDPLPGLPDIAPLGQMAGPGEIASLAPDAPALAFVDPRLARGGVRLLLPPGAPWPDAPLVEPATWEAHRLALGLPDGARDLEVDKALILENGFAEMGGVDFAKGCYMGQELTARMHHRGLVRKRLMPVVVDGPLPESGAALFTDDGHEAGVMRSGLVTGRSETGRPQGLGLALLRLEARPPAGGALVCPASGARLVPHPPAWAADAPGADAPLA